MLLGSGYLNFSIKAIKLVIEVAETKPWNLADGSLNFETLQVTTNLELALRYLRRETRARTLWIDALCINQENKIEKTMQIQRMERIYANASPIVVCLGGYHWLGHDDRDRLYAVLGIAGGAATGKATNMASFMENISSYSTRMILANHSNFLWDHHYNFLVKVGVMVFFDMYSLWGIFYEERAKYWTIHRPEYVVAGHREVLGAVTGGPGEQPNRLEFFTAIAKYLAKETNSLAFLDGATCGEDNDVEMPSWVPKWTRELNKPAYDFARRVKKDRALDLFIFTDGSKTLQLAGLSNLRVNIMLLTDLDLLQSSPWQGAFEKISVLSTERKNLVASSLNIIGITMYQKSFFMLRETEQRSISSAVNVIKCCLGWGLETLRATFLAAGGTTMVYNYNVTAPEIGFLRVGEVVKDDRLVFVPGCFHHLVLRSQKRTTEKSNRWKLVALADMVTTTTPERDYSMTEWVQLLKDGVSNRYDIE